MALKTERHLQNSKWDTKNNSWLEVEWVSIVILTGKRETGILLL